MSALGPNVPPQLEAALASAQTLSPQSQGNTTGSRSDAFNDQIQTAVSALTAAVPLAPDAVSAHTVVYVLQRLQWLSSPGMSAAMAALGQLR